MCVAASQAAERYPRADCSPAFLSLVKSEMYVPGASCRLARCRSILQHVMSCVQCLIGRPFMLVRHRSGPLWTFACCVTSWLWSTAGP